MSPEYTDLLNAQVSLRDYFAAVATEEDIKLWIRKSGPDAYVTSAVGGIQTIGYRTGMRTREEARYKFADAMIKARREQ